MSDKFFVLIFLGCEIGTKDFVNVLYKNVAQSALEKGFSVSLEPPFTTPIKNPGFSEKKIVTTSRI